MRFLPEGPNIPDELLAERDNGNVVFLCGAGVSYPAGMPDFLGLARFVVEELGTPQNAPSRDMLSMWKDETIPAGARPSLDQIFNLLQQEYAAGDVDYLIAKKLKTPRGANLSAHKTILSLSRSSNGEPQIVTTNFDLLFEKAAQRKLKTHVAPALPDLAGMRSFDGIVYLHGRIDYRINRGEGRQNFVVSSSDFGRAYLAEGWATRFVRDLLDQYIVILLGYSANDPPVRYLLQGLHAQGQGRRAKLFAFDSGAEEDVQHRWRDMEYVPWLTPRWTAMWHSGAPCLHGRNEQTIPSLGARRLWSSQEEDRATSPRMSAARSPRSSELTSVPSCSRMLIHHPQVNGFACSTTTSGTVMSVATSPVHNPTSIH